MSSPSSARQTTAATIASAVPRRQQRPRTAPKQIIERDDVYSGQQPGDRGVPAASATPHLADDAAVRDRRAPGQPLTFHQCHDIAVAALNSDKRPYIQDQHQAAPWP